MLPRPPLQLRLRTWLMALSMAAMLPVLVLAGHMLWTLKSQQQREALNLLAQRSQEVSRAVADRLNISIGTLRSLAASRAALGEEWPALHEQARRVVRQTPELRAIALVDAQGRLNCLTSAPWGTDLGPAAHPERVRQALETQQPNVSGLFESPISPMQVVAVTVPLAAQAGAPRHALRAILSVDSLNQMLADQGLPEGWVMGIADRGGVLVARNRSPERFVGQRASDSFIQAINGQDTRMFHGTTLDGTRTTNLVVPIYGGDWFLGMGVPDALLDEPMWQLLRSMVLLTVSWLALALLIGSVLADYLVRQFRLVGQLAASESMTWPEDVPLRVSELHTIAMELIQTRRRAAAAHDQLGTMTLARDEVQDLYEHAPCGYHSLDREGRVVRMNQTELNWLGCTREDVIGRPFRDFVAPGSVPVFKEAFDRFLIQGEIKDVEVDLMRGTGTPMPVLISATAIKDASGQFLMTRSMVFDNTERKVLEAQLDRLARTDALTSLSNRRDFYDRAEHELARCARHGHPLALLMLDIDHFKSVNDTHGHAIGDRVLRHLSQGLREVLRENDLPARLGGEEFAVLLPDTPIDAACEVAERLRQHLAHHPVPIDDGQRLRYTVSIGVAEWRATNTHIDEIIHRADTALYAAKQSGRDRVVRSEAAPVV